LAEEVGLPARTEEAGLEVDIRPPEVEAATWAEAMLRLGEVAAIREPGSQPRVEEEEVMELLQIGQTCGRAPSLEETEWLEERDLPLFTSLLSSDRVPPAEESDALTWLS
jgi:hypothetical protein